MNAIFGQELYDLTPIQENPDCNVMQVFLSRNNAVDQFELVEMSKLSFKSGDEFTKRLSVVGVDAV